MYKIWNKLFGWDYIHWNDSTTRGVARVFLSKCRKVSYWRYSNIKVLEEIKAPKQVTWLTCDPSKYFNSNNGNLDKV